MKEWTEGDYVGTPITCRVGSTASGAMYLEVDFHIKDENEELHTVRARIYFSEKIAASPQAAAMLKKRLLAVGFNGDFEDPQVSANEVALQLKKELYKDRIIDKWEIGMSGVASDAERKKARDVLKTIGFVKKDTATPPVPAPVPAPVPPAVKTPPVVGEVMTRQKAWEAVLAGCNGDSMAASAAWQGLTSQRSQATGRVETSFTSEDWQWVTNNQAPW